MRSWLFLLLALPLWAQPLLSVTPEDGAVITESRPLITVNLPPDVDHGSARLWVDKQELTFNCLRTPTFVSARPMDELKNGKVEARFWARGRGGVAVERRWSFQVKSDQGISSLTHDASDSLAEYDTLTVDLKGASGGKAWFEVEGVKGNHPMQEIAAGHYRGSYLVEPGHTRMQMSVVGYLEVGRRLEKMTADRPVRFFANIFRVKILSPESGTQLNSGTFTVKGRTRPNSTVVAVMRVTFNENTPPPSSTVNQGEGTEKGVADAQGFFEVHYDVPVTLPNMWVVMNIFAIDEEGNRSVPAIVRYQL
ncbi:hypothetical protein DYH09_04195 [bacterium CPR1]|nr:hypothetical protein [bacterium CPR1]